MWSGPGNDRAGQGEPSLGPRPIGTRDEACDHVGKLDSLRSGTIDGDAPLDAGMFAGTPVPDEKADVSVAALALLTMFIVALVALAVFISRLDEVIGLVLVAVTLAWMTSPVTSWLERFIGRVGSLVATALGSIVVAGVASFFVLRQLSQRAETLSALVTDRLDELEPGSLWARLARSTRLPQALDAWLGSAPTEVVVGAESSVGIGRSVIFVLTVVILATFFQASAPKLRDAIVALWSRDDRARVRSFFADVDRRGAGNSQRSFVLAVLSGGLVAGVLAACGLPGELVLGVWAGAWLIVPAVGPFVAVAPLAAFTLIDGGVRSYLALAGVSAFAALAVIARRRFIDTKTFGLGVGPAMIAVALGTAVGGIDGAVVALFLAALAVAAATSPDLPQTTPSWTLPVHQTASVGSLTVPLGFRGLGFATGSVVVGVLFWSLLSQVGASIVWLLVGAFVAVAFSRPVAWLRTRMRVSHHVAVSLMALLIVAIVFFVSASLTTNGAEATNQAVEDLPEVVATLERAPLIGSWLENRDASVWVTDQMEDLPQRLSSARSGADWLPQLGTRLMDLFWTVLLGFAFILDGGRLVHATERRVPARWRRQFSRLVGVAGVALTGYAAGAALVAGINAAVVFAIALSLGLGLAPVLAIWSFTWNFVPQIGGFVGGLPLLVLALVAGPTELLLASGLFLVYQLVENLVIQPAVISSAIDIPAWATLLGAIAGGTAAGVVGAVVLTPLAGVVRVMWVEYRRQDFPGNTVQMPIGDQVT